MKRKKTVLYYRKRTGKTNYKKRLALLKSKKPRLIIRKTNKQIIIQIAEYTPAGDKMLCGVNSNILKKAGWKYSCNNLSACYLAGLFLGKKALAKKVGEAILDSGLQTMVPGSRIYAALKGVVDAGVKIPCSEKAFPLQERLSGKHITSFFSANKNPAQFSDYKKRKADPAKLQQDFEVYKKKIISK
ncbi:50S ribosomal protein L18 [Candidatus Woesearchaeota archaeon]|nr:50S ribosomal protein L18 [Candidatus Woesearchaeota archaeon]